MELELLSHCEYSTPATAGHTQCAGACTACLRVICNLPQYFKKCLACFRASRTKGTDAKGLWTAVLLHPDGTRARILWSAGAPQDVSLPPSWQIKQAHDLSGKATALGAQKTISVGAAPNLLTSFSMQP